MISKMVVCDNCRLTIDGDPIVVGYTMYEIPRFERSKSGVSIDRKPILAKAYLCSERCKDEFLKKEAELASSMRVTQVGGE